MGEPAIETRSAAKIWSGPAAAEYEALDQEIRKARLAPLGVRKRTSPKSLQRFVPPIRPLAVSPVRPFADTSWNPPSLGYS